MSTACVQWETLNRLDRKNAKSFAQYSMGVKTSGPRRTPSKVASMHAGNTASCHLRKAVLRGPIGWNGVFTFTALFCYHTAWSVIEAV